MVRQQHQDAAALTQDGVCSTPDSGPDVEPERMYTEQVVELCMLWTDATAWALVYGLDQAQLAWAAGSDVESLSFMSLRCYHPHMVV